ncbi:uncharacterized protein K02A2.6-like [Teleopsis dalmanni]|uniref:uncharacterized protein K02A2.6-like n=1 Tax=Teleopsis dalmanni TaxID=139649 RepID=UPI0018CD91C3|nr:uncharacterized protein K02A2.6-like [Teleopsis dalmanni]
MVTKEQQRLPDLCTSEGYVHKRTDFRSGDPLQEDSTWKLWVPSELRWSLAERVHVSPSSGHGGMQKTLAKLKVSYRMRKPLMGMQTITEKPFQRLYVDFMGPYPGTNTGNTVIFVGLDHFSKYVFLKLMRSATVQNMIKYLEADVFHTFGVPEIMHSDNGKQFISEAFKSFLQKYGVKHIRTGFYSPQANAAERVNQSVLQIVRSYIQEHQCNWDQYVSEAAFALRSVKHSSIGMEP